MHNSKSFSAGVTVLSLMLLLTANAWATFTRTTVDSTMAGDVMAVGDIDGDGFPDLVNGGLVNTEPMTWYRYVTPTSWTKTVIANPVQEWTEEGQLFDVNGDGALDIIAPDGNAGNVQWLKNPVKTASPFVGSNWTVNSVGSMGSHVPNVSLADFNGDGRADVVARTVNQCAVFFQTSTGTFTKSSFSFTDPGSQLGNEGLTVGDVNKDGRIDIIARGRWYQNPGGSGVTNLNNWTERVITNNAVATNVDFKAVMVDLDGDGLNDVIYSSSENTADVNWFRQTATGTWETHTIAANVQYAHTLQVADMNNDGHLDVVVGQMNTSTAKDISIYSNANYANDAGWTQTIVDTTGIHNGLVVDVGANGGNDIYGCNGAGNPPLYLWLNSVPEPGTLALLSSGILLALRRRKGLWKE